MRRAFSLIELSIAMAMAGLIVAAAASAGVSVTRIMKLDGKKSAADQDARRLVDFLLTNLQSVGGGQVRPWMGTWVEQQGCSSRASGLPACGTNDRVTLVDVDPNRGSCQIVSIVNATTVRFARVGPSGPCCYAWDGIPDGGPADQYVDQPLMFVRGRSQWAMRVGTGEIDESVCSYGLSGVDPLAGWTATGGAPADSAPVTAANFASVFGTDSTATVVQPRTLFVESDTTSGRLPRLVEWVDVDVNGLVDTGEVRLVFPGVMSFHMALGYDSDPEDGRITNTASTGDEWVGNVSGDTLTGLDTAGLRMATAGIITGVKAVDPGPRTLQVLDGAAVSNSSLILRRAVGQALLRNVAVFY